MDVATLCLLGRKERQQDLVQICAGGEQLTVLVLDGHGSDGERAAQLAAEILLEEPLQPAMEVAPRFVRAHEAIAAANLEGGTAAAYVQVGGGMVDVAWAGDVEARLIKKDGRLVTLTIPHRYGVHRKESVRLLRLGATILHQGRRRGRIVTDEIVIEVSRALGDADCAPYVICQPEHRRERITEDDHGLLIATDGLWEVLARRISRRAWLGRALVEAESGAAGVAALSTLLSRCLVHDNTTLAYVRFSSANRA